MTAIRSTRYTTGGGITVYRASVSTPYDDAAAGIRSALDARRGVLFTSNVEFPGRYTCWDIGFVNPPLAITCSGREMTFSALNARGQVLLRFIAPVVGACEALQTVQQSTGGLVLMLKPPRPVFFEEERSRQDTVFSVLRDVIAQFFSEEDAFLGLYGAFGYELAFQFEAIGKSLRRAPGGKDFLLYLPDDILVVDHRLESARRHRYDFEYCGISTRHLPRTGSHEAFTLPRRNVVVEACDHGPGEYADTVRKAIGYFARGDLFEAVPGQLFREPCRDSPAAMFSRLSAHNPSPYGAFINLGEQEYLVAASPEMFVRVESTDAGMRVETCPISGTIARGKDAIEDAAQIRTLLNSAKDEAELSMCTDVDRNDKSRVCEPGSVRVIGRRQTEMYSRLIHTVDHVVGILRPGFDALDAFLSHTWAVTVTGAPKQAAIRFIEEHEKSPRRWYGGALGFLKFNGEINTGLTLRTIRIDGGIAEVRAGATLLFDSDPDAEEAETRLKASALLSAIRNDYVPGTASKSATHYPGQGIDVLMVDHQDSFVHTLSAYFQQTGARVSTVRPENVAAAIAVRKPGLVVLSPGPGKPVDFQLAATLDQCLQHRLPVFGVCLGLQGIVEYFGGTLSTLGTPVHGKGSVLARAAGSLFAGLELPLTIGRYHSLVADKVPECLQITAKTHDGCVMAIEHSSLPISAVQFHPESILSLGGDIGAKIIANVMQQITMNAHSFP
ncbi:MAG: anthranilate synthase component I [Pseudomonadales bacterium]|nr:anthranilate synthase component I [Pseudomonadales bacterium]